jgi:hypothetical protein
MSSRAYWKSTLIVVLGIFVALSTVAQDKKSPTDLRTIRGGVVDKNETPASGSVVYLLNVKTQAVRTYIADEMGVFRFSGLDPNVDYQVHAEHGDLASATRTVSSFDSRRDIDIALKLSHNKSEH